MKKVTNVACFLEQRIGNILNELKEQMNPVSMPIESYKYRMTEEPGFEKIEPAALKWDVFHANDVWGGHRKYYWFSTEAVIPSSFEGRCVAFRLTTNTEDQWDATNAQFCLYINGQMRQGLDVNHRSAIITEKAAAGTVYRIALYAFTGDHNDDLRLKSCLTVVDRDIKKLYFDLKVPYEVAMLSDENDTAHIDTIQCLNEAINRLDLRIPFSEEYYDSVKRAQKYITKEFYEKMCGRSRAEVWCVGHTHIDVAWQWTLSVTRGKAFRNFSTVLEMMKHYPDYIFMSSQPQLYQFVKEQSPELFDQIRRRVKEGRWEPEGGMFLEADCNISSGESLVRQILYGKEFFRKEFGVDSKVLWLPDVFGYSAALPQIMQKSGIPYFMTTKISWNDTNKLPYDTFMWEGIDGSKVLTHFISATDYNPSSKAFNTTYNGNLNPSQIKGTWHRYQQKNLNNKVLMSFGYGDGGGGPTYEMLENYERLSKGLPGCPKAVMATARGYFEKLDAETKGSKYLPQWVGELYLEYHRGTYTTMARNKKYNRRSEFTYQNAELFSVLNHALTGAGYPKDTIRDGWNIILLNQFHDILPGSSIKEVYEESREQYEEILSKGRKLIGGQCAVIAGRVSGDFEKLVVFNPLGYERTDMVSFDMPEGYVSPVVIDTDENGKEQELECQLIDGRRAIFTASRVPPKGYKSFRIREDSPNAKSTMKISEKGFSNDFYDAVLDDTGSFVSIYDKRAGREVLQTGKKGNVLTAYEDKPFEYDAWNIESYYKEKSWPVDDVQSIRVTETGPVRGALQITRKFLRSTIVQTIYIYSALPRIDIKSEIDWHEKQVLLRTSFPVDVHADYATYEIQYGNVRRPTHCNTSWDAAKFEVCAHKWADLSEDGFGVSVLNDCKYGCDIHNGVIGLSLLKSPVSPNPDADREKHEFIYSLFPHAGGWREAGTVQQAYAINNPLSAVYSGGSGDLPASYSLFRCDAANVVMEAVKQAEDGDGVILRLYECFNRRCTVHVVCAGQITYLEECDLLENGIHELRHDADCFAFEIKPYEIKTFRLKF